MPPIAPLDRPVDALGPADSSAPNDQTSYEEAEPCACVELGGLEDVEVGNEMDEVVGNIL
jgi:hypothetical protein